MAGCLWSQEETKALLGLWGDASVQKEQEGAKRNKAVFIRIASEMNKMGYKRTWQQCRVKVKNVVSKYRKIRDSNRRSGRGRKEFAFHHEVDAVLGTRPASEPAVLLSSTGGDALVEENADKESSGEDG